MLLLLALASANAHADTTQAVCQAQCVGVSQDGLSLIALGSIEADTTVAGSAGAFSLLQNRCQSEIANGWTAIVAKSFTVKDVNTNTSTSGDSVAEQISLRSAFGGLFRSASGAYAQSSTYTSTTTDDREVSVTTADMSVCAESVLSPGEPPVYYGGHAQD